jgi:hypothetical protein
MDRLLLQAGNKQLRLIPSNCLIYWLWQLCYRLHEDFPFLFATKQATSLVICVKNFSGITEQRPKQTYYSFAYISNNGF